MEVSVHFHIPAALPLPPGERTPGAHWIEGWVGPRAGLDVVTRCKRNPAPTGNRTPAVHPVAEITLPFFKL
jgi:hypothetical protein